MHDHTTVIECEAPRRLVLRAWAWPFGVVRAELTITGLPQSSIVTLSEEMLAGLGIRFPRIAALVQRARNRRSLRRY